MPNNVLEPEIPYKAFSGANITATIGNKKVGSLQALTCSITREVAALYGFGDANPKAFVKGKRGIAGSLVFTQFDRHAILQEVFKEAFDEPLGKQNALFTSQFANLQTDQGLLSGISGPTRNFAHNVGSALALAFPGGVGNNLDQELQTIYNLVRDQKLRYADQIPEFDITLTFVNESGDAAFCKIGGVILVNEGWGYTLDDLTSEAAYTYVARAVTPLTSLTNDKLFERWTSNGLSAASPR
jgi:hypothetical protein